MTSNPLRRLIAPALMLIAVSIVGMIGYEYFLGWSLIDSLYMVVITFTTAGWRDISEMNHVGRLFDIFIVVTGLGVAIFTLEQFIEIVASGELLAYRRRKKMKKQISQMKGHYLICGFGRVGRQVAAELSRAGVPFVVIDNKPEIAQELDPQGVPYLLGDITADQVLKEADIEQAAGLIASADSDTANVFVTLSARVLNPRLFIIARAGLTDSEEKLKKAGANQVISPYFTAGRHMAEIVIGQRGA